MPPHICKALAPPRKDTTWSVWVLSGTTRGSQRPACGKEAPHTTIVTSAPLEWDEMEGFILDSNYCFYMILHDPPIHSKQTMPDDAVMAGVDFQ